MPPSRTTALFTLTWRTLSHAAVPAVFAGALLDANGLLPRALCPGVYDEVVRASHPSIVIHEFVFVCAWDGRCCAVLTVLTVEESCK